MAEWETVILDGEKMISRREAHDHLTERLGLPEYYGRNLDALFDLLSTRIGETRLVVQNAPLITENLGPYGRALLDVLEDAAAENPGLAVELRQGPV